jgi:hypothetical protein
MQNVEKTDNINIWRNHILTYIVNNSKNGFIEFTMFTFGETNFENKPWLWGRHINPLGYKYRPDKSINME